MVADHWLRRPLATAGVVTISEWAERGDVFVAVFIAVWAGSLR